ncbi:MAG: hypothetical protein D6710_11955 [Nitrospirae bacterium]|nr:MAG: hypothetical protein D6710_11955 [Nitrospirota bacterium]
MGGHGLIIWYGISSFVFGLLLFFPTRKLILAMSVNRIQRRTQREITSEELAKLKRKVTIIAAIVSLSFAFLYNRVLMFKYFGGVG